MLAVLSIGFAKKIFFLKWQMQITCRKMLFTSFLEFASVNGSSYGFPSKADEVKKIVFIKFHWKEQTLPIASG